MISDPVELRELCRSGEFISNTSNVCSGYVQANLIVLPKEAAADFEQLCFRNPVPCPLVGKTKVGDPTLVESPLIKSEVNIAKDIPRYVVYENGKYIEEKTDIANEWSNTHVGFLIGCSFSFENELIENGLTPKNVTLGRNVAMYRTTRLLDPAGIFTTATYVVSMRPYKETDISKVREITSQFWRFHGGPIAWGYEGAKALGITDLSKPDYGDAVDIADDEVPVFWGCGVTPQAVVEAAGSLIKGKTMAHAPGYLLITDVKDEEAKRFH